MSAINAPSREYATQFSSTVVEQLYLSKDYADFQFIFNCGKRIPAHKNILGTASDVFRAMFSGSYIEKTEAKIVDASANAFKEFLQFIYLPKAIVTLPNAAEVMYLGKKYDITECFNICAEFLKMNINDENVLWIYETVEHLGHEQLKETCTRYVELNTKEILESDGFLTCDRKIVKWIIHMDTLSCPEVEVVEALIKWMKAKSGQAELTPDIVQNQFSELVHEIRFGSMTMDMFSALIPSYGALVTLDEHKEIVQMINSDQFQPTIFKKNRRHTFREVKWDYDAIIKCDRLIEDMYEGVPYYIKNVETATFTVNKRVLLGGFICSRTNYIEGPSISDYCYSCVDCEECDHNEISHELRCEITVTQYFGLENRNGQVVHFEEMTNLSEYEETEITFPTILIQPGLTYQIRVKVFHPEGYWLTTTLKKEVEIEPGIVVKFHNDTTVENAARGLVEKLLLNHFE